MAGFSQCGGQGGQAGGKITVVVAEQNTHEGQK
jgi:hypothetical protein